ncbi:MAG: glycosyltransferase family 4 protein [Candidatus Latescibacterota bacterium]|nr:glycosyltransferase family 4 protein [Candidatus Latescibacterota bacterium]
MISPSPYRVLLFGSEFPPSPAGTATYTRNLALGLAQQGMQVTVLTQQDPSRATNAVDAALPGIAEVIRIPYTGLVPLRYLRCRRALKVALQQVQPHCLWTTNGMATRVAGTLPSPDCALISSIRGSDIRTRFPGHSLMRCIESIPQRRCYQSSQGVAAACDDLRRLAVDRGLDGDRIFVSHSALDPGIASAPSRVAREPATVLTVARLNRQKRVDVVLQAIAALRDDQPELRYVVVGDGPQARSLMALAESLGIADRLHFAGTFEPLSDELCNWYRRAGIFAMTSAGEGLANVYMEAGIFGLPCVGANDGGTPEVIRDGDTGMLVPVDDVAATAAALGRLLADPELAASMGARAREWIDLEFSIETLGQRSSEIIHSVVGNGCPPANLVRHRNGDGVTP